MASRLEAIQKHVIRDLKPGTNEVRVDSFPQNRQTALKWNGWGFKGAGFELNESGVITFQGEQYDFGGTELPALRQWMEEERGIDLSKMQGTVPFPSDATRPIPDSQHAFLQAVGDDHGGISHAMDDRVFHSHGHTCQEIYALRNGDLGRVPDLVIWPRHHDDVVKIVQAANACDVVIIPFGGGTSVTGAVQCPEKETRMIVSLDTSKMNRILWINSQNMTARIEAGVTGQALERKLAEFGVCTGHTPDSYEFSTLGGWIATRASGMKKNIYGNIEDMVIQVRLVTTRGVMEMSQEAPRMSAGPSVNEMVMGSEGTLGVITEATVKIAKLPEASLYNSIAFPTFKQGIDCMNEIALRRLRPASIRLMDNEQFVFGRALKPAEASMFGRIMDSLKTFYVTKVKGFDPKNMAVATLLLEGNAQAIKKEEAEILGIAYKYGGIAGGEENGRRGYLLTFVIAYLRDIAMDYQAVAESFETSIPHSCVENLCRNVKDRILDVCREEGVKHEPYASSRVTQLYDTGVCVYFYFGFVYEGLPDPMATFHRVEVAAREEVLANGGSISHHHGVGKVRKKWFEGTVSTPAVKAIQGVKSALDPNNIFASGNLT
eukprot:m.76311 g.76311  ORF g.76311 m.76311 type:complete len:604 (-) comp12551_c0_seq2:3428-5239(-)